MKNMNLKKALACICVIALLLNMIVLPGEAVTPQTPQSNTLTFSDFGMDDMTHADNAYTGSAQGVTSLDGKTFEGYITMGLYAAAYQSVRIGTTALAKGGLAWNGIGVRAHNANEWEIGNYNVAGGSGGSYDSLTGKFNPADYGITYNAATNTFSEVKLTMSWDYVEGTTDIIVVIKLNDKECFNDTVTDLQNNIGTNIFLWSYKNTPISVRSVATKPVAGSVRNLTFTDLKDSGGNNWVDGAKSGQMSGDFPADITTGADLDGVAFNGNVTLGALSSNRTHSIRIGGSSDHNGIGFVPVASGIRIYHFQDAATADKGVVLKEFSAADYGITYDQTNGYGAFKFRILYQNIPNTTNTWVTITINNKACYEGVIANGQNVLGNCAWVWGRYSSITTISVVATDDEEETVFESLTFSDFGVDDMTQVKDAYTGSLPAGTSLDGKIFEGYFTMGFANGNSYHSVRIGTKDSDAFSGIGIRARDAQTWEIRNYAGNSGGASLVENLAVADYGITCENGSFSEVKLSISWDYVESSTDVKVVIKLNDKECYNGVVTNLQNNIGTKLFVWSYNEVPISVRSVATKPVADDFRNLTFTDLLTTGGANWVDGTFPSPSFQQSGTFPADISTGADLDGVAFNGNVAIGLPATGSQSTRYQSVRIGGSRDIYGIGFTPAANGNIRIYRYTNTDAGVVLKQFKAADYGITYDETNGYGAFDFRITYQNIPNSTNTWVAVTVNDKACYEGVVANGQSVLGNRAWMFAYTSPITITSVVEGSEPSNPGGTEGGGEESDIPVTKFESLTFSDFGMDDMTNVKDAYTGSLPEGTSLNGKIFEGYFTMGFENGSSYHSVRIGTTTPAAGGEANCGIGIRAHSATEWQINNFKGNSNGTSLVDRLVIADYGITYDEGTGSFSEVKLSISWDYVEGTKDVKVVIKLNDKECFNGTVTGLQNNIGTKIYIWSWQEVPISIRSVATKPAAGKVQNKTFEDVGYTDGTFVHTPKWTQKGGTFSNVTTGADLDGIVFNGKVAIGKPATGSQYTRYQSIRIGGTNPTNGIGFTPFADGVIRLYHYSKEDGGIVLKEIKAADYGITYDETNGYGVFDFSIAYQNIPDTANTWVTVTVNGKVCYDGVIANGQTALGNRTWLFAYTSSITITSVAYYEKVDFTEFGFTTNWAVELGLKKEGA